MANRCFLVFAASLLLALQACTHPKKVYTSECAPTIKFKHISFANLVDSAKFYDDQYVEVTGKYVEGKHISALVDEATFSDHANDHSLWVNFTQECPLYRNNEHDGLFGNGDNEYNLIKNHRITIRGRVQATGKGYLKAYRATINEVSYLELY